MHSPDLLILDEPTTGVDPLSRRQFWALVDDLRREHAGMTVIVATAYIEEAQRFERLLAMDAGRLLENKPTADVLADYGTDVLEEAYVKMLPPEKQQGSGGLDITPFVPDPAAPPAMEAHGLTKRFGDFTAVDHVSLPFKKARFSGFLGSNGCGKSTTMKNADRPVGSDRRRRHAVGQADRRGRPGHEKCASVICRRRFRCMKN